MKCPCRRWLTLIVVWVAVATLDVLELEHFGPNMLRRLLSGLQSLRSICGLMRLPRDPCCLNQTNVWKAESAALRLFHQKSLDPSKALAGDSEIQVRDNN
jgi:hypothetical protein